MAKPTPRGKRAVAQPVLDHRVQGIVKRSKAETYVLTTLVSFAASVIVTRVYLELTGYPQLGSGDLHIAHVLWGGLALYIAGLLPLILLNRGALTWSAILNGVGVGLFIDEVGKFITKRVDYFYPPAAPIIYAFFLLSVLLYFLVRRPIQKHARSELFRALEELPALLDGALLEQERQAIVTRLTYAQQSADPKFAALATALSAYLVDEQIPLADSATGFVQTVQRTVIKWGQKLGQQRHRRIVLWLVGLQSILAVISVGLLVLILVAPQIFSQAFGQQVVTANEVRSVANQVWFVIRFVLQIGVSFIALWAFVLLWRGQEERGISAASFGLILSLTTVILLTFYLNQFGAISYAVFQFGLLLFFQAYQQWYVARPFKP
ncbi:hypothetical protein BH10CHL1_BH10CHL1_45960 [soil metagenome]